MAGLAWIGPPPDAIGAMGSRSPPASGCAQGVPIMPGARRRQERSGRARSRGPGRLPGRDQGVCRAAAARACRSPLGGGGRARFRVRAARGRGASPTRRSTSSATRGSATSRSDARDEHGNVVHLGERDCSIQRRHQKLVEETPSPAVDGRCANVSGASPSTRRRSAISRPAPWRAPAADGSYYFLEMNTRIQVEHTVTEMVTGLDLVREQILIAAGEKLLSRRRTSCSAATRSSAGSTPRIRQKASCRARAGSPRTVSRRVSACAWTRPSARATRCRASRPLVGSCRPRRRREHARRRMLRARGVRHRGHDDPRLVPPRPSRGAPASLVARRVRG